jgi:hypothetical protein
MAKEAKKHIIDDLLTKVKKTSEAVKPVNKPVKVPGPAEQSFDPKRQTPHMSPDGITKRDGKKRFDF